MWNVTLRSRYQSGPTTPSELLRAFPAGTELGPAVAGQWVASNMTAVFKSSSAVFLAKGVIQKLVALGYGQLSLELLEDLVIKSLDTHVDLQPLLIAVFVNPVSHGLAKEIVAQVDIGCITRPSMC